MTDFNEFINQNKEEIYKTLKEFATIPAPSGHEEKRAEYCLDFVKSFGGYDAYIDDALNVILPVNTQSKDKITVFAAHTDIVFGFDVPLTYKEEDGKIFCPGIGDDTASAVVLLYTAKYFIQNSILPSEGALFVFNSCEEGMGNLKGTRQLMEDYAGRIKQFVTYDSQFGTIVTECVGSHRYKVDVATEGGHSFGKFGNTNAIAELAKIVGKIYELSVPVSEGSRTTYNVGTIEGGTSVNTIAQDAAMLCEYRSDNRDHLEIMKNAFREIFDKAITDKVNVAAELVGERPCSNVDKALQLNLADRCRHISEEIYGKEIVYKQGSTDCNIPMSMGIPAVCVGVYEGDKSHTREEWIEKDSVLKGLLMSLNLTFELCGC